MSAPKIVVIGASMGGIDALCDMLKRLPRHFRPSIFIVQHIGRAESILPVILTRCGTLKASHPRNGERFRPGQVYVAPPNQHMVLRDGIISLQHGPRENRSRPAINPLFRSAARCYRDRVIGIILSGQLDDGVAGLFAIKARGGTTIVQDPNEAVAPSMPSMALRNVEIDHVLPVAKISSLLVQLSEEKSMRPKKSRKTGRAKRASALDEEKPEIMGKAVPMVCPDCHGPLFELKNGKLVRFNCIVGHSFSPVSLSDAHADALERALWVTIRTLKEKLTLQRALVARQANRQEEDLAARMVEDAEAIEQDIKLLQQIQQRI